MNDSNTIPEHLLRGLNAYAHDGIPTGSFLRAVLENDLMMAVGRADPESLAALPAICAFVNYELPSACHGSPENVAAWIKAHEPEATP